MPRLKKEEETLPAISAKLSPKNESLPGSPLGGFSTCGSMLLLALTNRHFTSLM